MSRRTIASFLGSGALILLLGACGGGSSSTRSETSTPGSSSPSSPSTGSSTQRSTAHGSTVHTMPTSPAQTTTSIPSSNGAATAILPARFVASPDGSLTPPLIGGPAATTIVLAVISHASRPLLVAVSTHSLTVPPHGSASVRLAGLRAGRYTIEVDGRARAALVVGAQPGP